MSRELAQGDFREALLDRRSEEEWKENRLDHQTFYAEKYRLADETVTGRELVDQYGELFPDKLDVSLGTTRRRMFDESEVPYFSFADPDVLRGFLLSARSQSDWANTEVFVEGFSRERYSFRGINITGQMLAYHTFTDLYNEEHGTHYVTMDHQQDPVGERVLGEASTVRFIREIFERADIKAKYDSISDAELSSSDLREILLSGTTEDEWRKFDGGSIGFRSMQFDHGTLQRFTGNTLAANYDGGSSIEKLFREANLEIGTDPAVRDRKKEDYNRAYTETFDDPSRLREVLLQVHTERDWKKPQDSSLREERIEIGERGITLHTFMQLYGIHQYNKEHRTSYSFEDMQSDPELSPHLKSNSVVLRELLDLAGINYDGAFTPAITDLDLSDPSILRRFFFHAERAGQPINLDDIVGAGVGDFRKITFKDPQTGVEIKGHGLMLYHTAQAYTTTHPNTTIVQAIEAKQAKSNAATKNHLLQLAGLSN